MKPKLKIKLFKNLLNTYPPYWGSGISVKYISDDYREVIVTMKLRWYNRNYFKAHFGGSLFSMTDPFYMLMLIHILGRDYIVLDKSAHINFVKPGRGTVIAKFIIDDKQINDITEKTAEGEKYYKEFTVNVTDIQDETVAEIKKVVYIRKKSR